MVAHYIPTPLGKYVALMNYFDANLFQHDMTTGCYFNKKPIKWNDKNIEPMSLIAILPDRKLMSFDTSIKPKK